MRLVVSVFGRELLRLETFEPSSGPDKGDCISERVGFVPSWPDQRWQPGGQP